MEIKSVKSYKNPEYPRKDFFVFKPALLAKYIPKAWKKNKLLAMALGIFAIGNCGDLQAAPNPNNNKIPDFRIADKLKKILIAPLFRHGDGMASIGGVAMTPTVILSEADARKIIEDELKKSDIVLDKTNVKIDEVSFDYKMIMYNKNKPEEKVVEANKYKLILDGLDTKHNIGYKFVTIRNYTELGGVSSASTLQQYNLVKVAGEVRDKLKKYGQINAAVFYDPLPVNKGQKYDEKGLKKEAEKLLREQVDDFVEWIKKEGGL